MIYFFEGNAFFAYILVCLFLIIFGTIKTKSHKVTFLILSSALCLYLSYVIELTQFPIFTRSPFTEGLHALFWSRINLVPFKDSLDVTSVKNILMAMPLGFLLPLIRRGNISTRAVLIMAVLFGVVIESLQLMQLLILGYTFRVIDINDVIFNFVGVMMGYLCFVLLRKIDCRLCKRFDAWFAAQL